MDSSSSYPHDESIDYKNSYDNCNDNDDDDDDDEIHRMIKRRNSDDYSSSSIVVDSLVDVSKICNTWVVEYCTMCTNYMDKQVQYETNTGIMSQYVNNAANKASSLLSRRPSAGTFDLQGSLAGYANCHIGNTTDNVRDMMFDEESVVESVISR